MLKLLMSGHALACLQQLRKEGLHHGLLPLLDVVLEQPMGFKFVTLALDSTDARIAVGKTVSPGFLFASLLWHQVLEKWTAYRAAGEQTIPALHLAADDVLDSQTEKLALQRKIGTDMRDIWSMQPRFERRTGKSPHKLLEHLRFRAGYDFLLLRCASGEIDAELGEWWTAFYEADEAEREALIASASRAPRAPRSAGASGTSAAAGVAGVTNVAGAAGGADSAGAGAGEAPKRKRAPRRSGRARGPAAAAEGGTGGAGNSGTDRD
jgi:poly(A) polymerase